MPGRGGFDAGKMPDSTNLVSPLLLDALRTAASGGAPDGVQGASHGASRQSVLYSRPVFRGFRGARPLSWHYRLNFIRWTSRAMEFGWSAPGVDPVTRLLAARDAALSALVCRRDTSGQPMAAAPKRVFGTLATGTSLMGAGARCHGVFLNRTRTRATGLVLIAGTENHIQSKPVLGDPRLFMPFS